VRLRALVHERKHGGSERPPERPRFERTDMGILESSEQVSGKVVVAARLHRRHPLAEAS
jgi:hypothetical protein